jgi:rapamycin-insensitive companion of mTOR
VSLFIKDLENIETTSSLNLSNVRSSLLSESINEGDEGESVVSSISDLSITSKKIRWQNERHNRNECLHCCRSKVSRLHLRTDSESSFVARKKLHQQNSLQLSDVSFNSPESVFSDESIPDRITGNILRHVQRMANPVWTKMSKMALLELKQKHPHSFQDICLYSEVCKALGRNTYRYAARRFLQEIFLDLDFDSFYNESNEIIERHDIDDDSIIIINKNDRDDRTGNNNNELHILQTQPQPSTSLFKLKSPPLASLFETSIENLSESFNSKSNKLNLISHTKQLQQPLPTQNSNSNSNNNKNNQIDVTDSSVISTSTTVKETFRPRLHTIELDLSCTKNKFPIRDRNIIVITSPNLFPHPRKLGETGNTELIKSTASQYQQQSTKSLSSSTPTSLYCERRLFSKSEATLMKK